MFKNLTKNTKFFDWIKFLFLILNVCINLYLRFLIQNSNFFYLKNSNPIGFFWGYFSAFGLLILVTFVIFYFEFWKKYWFVSVLILSGFYSNFLEKLIFDFVIDYINFQISYLNLADLQIFAGILLLNLQTFFSKKDN